MVTLKRRSLLTQELLEHLGIPESQLRYGIRAGYFRPSRRLRNGVYLWLPRDVRAVEAYFVAKAGKSSHKLTHGRGGAT